MQLSVLVFIEVEHAVSVFSVINLTINEWFKISTLDSDIRASKPGTFGWDQLSYLWPIEIPIRNIAGSKLLIIERYGEWHRSVNHI